MGNDFRDSLKVIKEEELKPLYTQNDIEKEELLRHYIFSQKKEFEAYMRFVNSILCVLKQFAIVSEYTRFLGRIKSVESSLKNDCVKTLNDVFGVEIDSATTGETAFLCDLITANIVKTKEAVHNKTNGYVAYHASGYPKIKGLYEKLEMMLKTEFKEEDLFDSYKKNVRDKAKEEIQKNVANVRDYFKKYCEALNDYMDYIRGTLDSNDMKILKRQFKKCETEYQKEIKAIGSNPQNQPIIEGKFETIETAIAANIGKAAHDVYKDEDMKEIQEEFDRNGGHLPLSKLPIMYRSLIETDEEGNPIPPRMLSSVEAAKATYPGLKLRKIEPKQR